MLPNANTPLSPSASCTRSNATKGKAKAVKPHGGGTLLLER